MDWDEKKELLARIDRLERMVFMLMTGHQNIAKDYELRHPEDLPSGAKVESQAEYFGHTPSRRFYAR